MQPSEKYGANSIVPALLEETLPAALAGLGLAAIAIGGLVPAQVMPIAAGNLFSRNVYKALVRPNATGAQLTLVSRRVSLVVKLGAVAFILAVPAKYVVNFQLAGGVWILQTLPAVFLVLFVKRLDRTSILAGMCAGLAWGTVMLAESGFESPTKSFAVLGGEDVYVGLPALALNLAIVAVGSALARRPRRRLAA